MTQGAHQRPDGPAPAIEDAAWRVLGTALQTGQSAFDSDLYTWTPEVAEELIRLLDAEPNNSSGDGDVMRSPVMQSLQEQLENAPHPVIVLAAELLYVQQLPLSTVTARLKRARVNDVLSWTEPRLAIPADLEQALDEKGPLTGGVGFNVQIREHLRWLAAFIVHWAELDEGTRDAALTDPWEFQRAARSTPGDWRAIRYSVQYLAWPSYFQPIVKHEHKQKIRDAFAELIGGPSGIDELDIDQDLHRIHAHLATQLGQPVDWYRGQIAHQWQRYHNDHSRRAWLVRPGRAGAHTAAQWVAQNRIALAATHLPRIPAHASRMEVSQAVEQGYPHHDYQARFQLTAEIYTFLSRMSPQDVVATITGGQLHMGTLTDDLGYVDDGGQQLERSVRWMSSTIDADSLPSPLAELITEPGSVVDLTDALDVLLGYMHPGRHAADDTPGDAPAAGAVPTLPAVTPELADTLHMSREELQNIVNTLQTRQQIVFYGPPGTGKTYLALELARFLAGPDDPSRVQLVQFHPSYSYEDFFEGYRPTLTDDGQPGFALQAGPLRRQAARAASEAGREHPHFLIIDEMNRADLARVFGEMYFLLEYRDRTVLPQYSPDTSFRLPRNLFIIGTMNTADRSIAMVDAAIRRRFAFLELHPDEAPVAGLLRRKLEADGASTEPADLLDALNAEMDESDRDLRIGPSYLMKDEALTPAGLDNIWRFDLLPLLEEHYYGRLTRAEVHDRFGLAALRRALRKK